VWGWGSTQQGRAGSPQATYFHAPPTARIYTDFDRRASLSTLQVSNESKQYCCPQVLPVKRPRINSTCGYFTQATGRGGGKHRKCRIASSPAYLTRIIQVTQYMGFKRQPLAKKNETALIDAKEMLVYRYNRISNLPGWLGPWILKTCRTRCREWSPITMGNGGASSYNLIGAKNLPSSLSCHRDVVLYIPHHNLTIQSCKACAKECQNACVQRKELGGNWDVQLRI
jgi:hypothetical protein